MWLPLVLCMCVWFEPTGSQNHQQPSDRGGRDTSNSTPGTQPCLTVPPSLPHSLSSPALSQQTSAQASGGARFPARSSTTPPQAPSSLRARTTRPRPSSSASLPLPPPRPPPFSRQQQPPPPTPPSARHRLLPQRACPSWANPAGSVAAAAAAGPAAAVESR